MNEIEAQQICVTASQALYHGSAQLANVPGLLRKIIENKLWLRRQVKMHGIVEMNSLLELITTKPLRGWGEDPAKIEAVIRDDAEVLAMWREAITPVVGTNQHSDNITTLQDGRGTSRSYTLSRLKREKPELYRRVVKKELSAHAASVEAGFRPRTLTIPVDPDKAAQVIRKHFSSTQRAALRERLK